MSPLGCVLHMCIKLFTDSMVQLIVRLKMGVHVCVCGGGGVIIAYEPYASYASNLRVSGT